MLHRLLVHKHISLDEAERILFKLRESTAAAEVGDIRAATVEVEDLLEDLIGGNTSTLNPFLFRHFWLGVDTRWPAGGDSGVLIVRIINDGPIPMPMLRMRPPVPEGWTVNPPNVGSTGRAIAHPGFQRSRCGPPPVLHHGRAHCQSIPRAVHSYPTCVEVLHAV